MEGTATPFELGDNQYVLLSIRDVSGRKEAEAKLIATGKELMRSNQELDRFAAMASHDLQEPLRMITSYLDLLVLRYAPSLDAKARSYIENANNGATRLSAMVRAILQYAQFERGAVSEPVDSMAAMHNAIKNLHQKIVDSEAEITFDPLPAVMAEEHQLSLVIQQHSHSAIPDLRAELVRRVARHRSSLSEVGASDKSGAVHLQSDALYLARPISLRRRS